MKAFGFPYMNCRPDKQQQFRQLHYSIQQRTQMGFPQNVREAVWNRCGGYCEKCGWSLNKDNWDWHHRKLKKHGGTDTIENGLALHHFCHIQKKDSVHQNPKLAYEKGWIVRSWDNASARPIVLPNGLFAILTPEGEYKYLGSEGK